MNPSRLLLGVRLVPVEVTSGPGNLIIIEPSERNLEQLQPTGPEGNQGSSQIETPCSYEIRVKHGANPAGRFFKPSQPVFERPGIVQTKILHVEHGKTPRVENIHYLTKRGRVGARKNPLPDPGIQRELPVASYEMQKSSPRSFQTAIDDVPEFAVILQADVLQHSHGNENIEAPRNVPVVLFDKLHAGRQTFLSGALAGVKNLLARNVESLDRDAIVPGHMEGQRAPAAAGFHDPVPWL